MYVPPALYIRAHTCTRDQPLARLGSSLCNTRTRVCLLMYIYTYRVHAGARVARIHARKIDEQRRHYVGFDDDIDFLAQSLMLLLLLLLYRKIREI